MDFDHENTLHVLSVLAGQDDEELFNSSEEEEDDEARGDVMIEEQDQDHPLLRGLVQFLVWRSLFGLSEMSLRPLLLFIPLFLCLAASLCKAPALNDIAASFPKTVVGLRAIVGIRERDFEKFIICPKCDTLYSHTEVVYDQNGCQKAIACQKRKFPSLPVSKRNPVCNAKLMEQHRTSSSRPVLKPIKKYAYRSIKCGMADLINRGDFSQRCQEWQKRNTSVDTYTDIYDGRVWKEHVGVLNRPSAIGLMLNVDWFQPFKHTTHSVGVLYLAYLNLPREERFKEENNLIVGVIPGPKEQALTCNSYLEPLVKDLQELREGVWLGDGANRGKWSAYLLCVACDTPAARKIGGFPAHNAVKGCNKSLLSFITVTFGTNYY